MRINVVHLHPADERGPARIAELTESWLDGDSIKKLSKICARPDLGLLTSAVPSASFHYAPTDAACTLWAAGGDISGGRLTGRARKYAWGYVRRRRQLAAVCEGLGLGTLIQIFPGHGNGRLIWRWHSNAAERCRELIAAPAQPTLTDDEIDALVAAA